MAFTTRKSLLGKVRDGDEISWHEFYVAYKPLVYLRGGDFGLDESEKEELLQQVMLEVFRKDILGKYDPEHVPDDVSFKHDPAKGRFRHFFRGIIRNHALKIRAKRKNNANIDEKFDLSDQNDRLETAWDNEWHQHLLTQSLDELKNQVSSEIFQAFELYAIQGRPVKEVADFLDMSVGSIYTAKSRCIDRLRIIIEGLEEK